MKQTLSRLWTTESGRQLIRLEGNTATVVLSECDASDLEELAEAAAEAAQVIRDSEESPAPLNECRQTA
jgi:hypothetical protein